jgi:flavin reductase (DIM6/NTAB) family NADH-FMN oxidoreductase RutF
MTPVVTPLADPLALRAALGQFATGVAIATARDGAGRRAGVTINSFASASLDPPLVLWSLGAAAASRFVFEAASHHAINVLASTQEPLARRFATHGADRFAGIALGEGPFGTVLIDGALAQLVCRVRERRQTGDHFVFVSEIVHHCRSAGEPLVFHASRYWTIRSRVEATPPTTSIRPEVPCLA